MRPLEPPTYLARPHFRVQDEPFGIRRNDRRSHVYMIGRTGTGKSTLLETMILQDLWRGEGLTLIDPHGDLVDRVAARIPVHRREDVAYMNIPDDSQPFGYNPLRRVRADRRALAASGLMEVLRTTWDDRAWGPRMEYVLRNAILALLDQEEASLPDVLRLLSEKSFRRTVAGNVENPLVRRFWEREFEKFSFRFRADSIAPIQTKVGAFLADPRLSRILVDHEEELRFRPLLDGRKVLLVNLSRGEIGSDSATLLGSLLVTTVALAAFSRADQPPASRPDHWLYVDEFHTFTTPTVATMLSELRKFGVGLTLAHQYLQQLSPEIRHAVLGNVGTLIAFRPGAEDAPFIARELAPKFDPIDLVNLPNHHIRLTLMIDGAPSRPFSALALPPWEVSEGVHIPTGLWKT